MSHEDFIKKLDVDNTKPTGERAKLDQEIREHIRREGSIQGIEGVYGDQIGAGAYIKRVIKNNDGVFSELYGCSYLWEGELKAEIVDSVAVTKGAYYETLRLFTSFPFYFALPLFLLPQARKRLITWAENIYFKDLEKRELPLNEYKKGIRELIRVLTPHFPKRLVMCFAMIMQFDNAYWYPLQDAMLNKDNAIDVLDTLIKRYNFESLKQKFRLVRRLAKVVLFLSPKLRKIEMNIFHCIEVYSSKADRYFMLNRRDYNYGGRSLKDRRKEWERVNKEKGHIILGL